MIHVEILALTWVPIRTTEDKAKNKIKCPDCPKSTVVHPNYVNAGIKACLTKCCLKMADVAKLMVELRAWTFVSLKDKKVKFICDKGHKSVILYISLRLGESCKTCNNPNRLRSNDLHEICDCQFLEIGRQSGSAWICEHYNHAVLHPNSAIEWDNDNVLNNGLTPNQLAPSTKDIYWFKCRNEECKMPFPKSLNERSVGSRCPYCYGDSVSENNCLATTHPVLCLEWDPENTLKPTEITYGSHKNIKWVCVKHEKPFKWDASPARRLQTGGICPMCNYPGYAQLIGGHEHFVKMATEYHGGRYSYPERYVKDSSKISINCPDHGLFRQTPNTHKAGAGCPACAKIIFESRGMKRLKRVLDSMGIYYIQEVPFDGCRYKKPLRIDIYIPAFNLVIEFDGKQHFKTEKFWGGEKELIKTMLRDMAKDAFCVRDKKNLWRIPHTDKITESSVKLVLEWCRSSQIYISYPHYQSQISKLCDLSGVAVVTAKCPSISIIPGT